MPKPVSKNLPAVAVGRNLYQDPPPTRLPRDRGLAWIILGAIFLAATAVLWQETTRIETCGGVLRFAWMIVDVEKLGGKWVLCGVSLLIGMGSTAVGAMEWLKCRDAERESSPPT